MSRDLEAPIAELVGNMRVAWLCEQHGISVEELVRRCLAAGGRGAASGRAPSTARPKSTGRTSSKPTKRRGAAGGAKESAAPKLDHFAALRPVETRTEAGREHYDAQVRAALSRGGRLSAVEIRDLAGGTPEQLRASVERLVHAREVAFAGSTRARRYWLR